MTNQLRQQFEDSIEKSGILFGKSSLSDIVCLEEDAKGPNVVFRGREQRASPAFFNHLDSLLNVTFKQKQQVLMGAGQIGLARHRNNLIASKFEASKKNIVVFGQKNERTLIGIQRVKESLIPSKSFFDAIETIQNTGDLAVRYSYTNIGIHQNVSPLTISVALIDEKFTQELVKNEAFRTKGVELTWTPTEIQATPFLERLSCTNGNIVTSKGTSEYLSTISPGEFSSFFEKVREKFFNETRSLLGERIQLAMETKNSIREMAIAQEQLMSLGFSKQEADDKISMTHALSAYPQLKSSNQYQASKFVGLGNHWDLYNVLTEAATHTKRRTKDDYGRRQVLVNAARFLFGKPDITHYEDAFSSKF